MTLPQSRRHECTVSKTVKLSSYEAKLLEVLLLRGPVPTSTEFLIEALWPDPDLEPEWAANHIAILIHRLRKKLGTHVVDTRVGLGYVLTGAVFNGFSTLPVDGAGGDALKGLPPERRA